VPFTLSHPAAILPLRRLGMPMTALVIGSMVPDIPLFMRWDWGYSLTHSPVGVAVVDTPLTLLLLGVWLVLVRDALVDLAPTAIRERLSPGATFSPRQRVLAPLAALVGGLTHIAWDAFTHPHRWGVRHLTWLQGQHAGMAGSKWAQYASGVFGFAIVSWAVYSTLRTLPKLTVERGRPVLSPVLGYVVILVAALTGVVSAVVVAGDGVHAMAFDGAVNALIALTLGTLLLSAGWHSAATRRRRQHHCAEVSTPT
jgi:hypothetical protein